MALRFRQPLLSTLRTSHRSFTISAPVCNGKRMGDDPMANQPDSVARKARDDTPNTDQQSSASQEEHKSGDDHPAKQPDPQSQPTRSTGIGGETDVSGGKEGLGARGDKQKAWDPERERKRGEGIATD